MIEYLFPVDYEDQLDQWEADHRVSPTITHIGGRNENLTPLKTTTWSPSNGQRTCEHCHCVFTPPASSFSIHCNRCQGRYRQYGMYELPKQWKGDKALKAVRRATQKVLQAVSVESCAEYRHAFRAVSNLFSSPPADAFHLYRSTPSLSQIQTTELKARYLSYHLLMHADHEELLGKALELVAVVTHDWSIINYAGEEVREIWLGHELIRSYRKPKVRTDRGVIRHWSYIDRDCKQVIGNALLKPLQALYNALQPAIAMRLKHELVISQKRTEARTEAVRYRHSQTMKAQRWPTMAKDYICGRIMTREEDGSWRPAIEAEMGNWRRFEYHAPTH